MLIMKSEIAFNENLKIITNYLIESKFKKIVLPKLVIKIQVGFFRRSLCIKTAKIIRVFPFNKRERTLKKFTKTRN